MKYRLQILAASALIAAGTLVTPSNAMVGAAIYADNYVKKQAKIALATPDHARWCAKNHKGYRKEWNTYPVGGGRISHCASPYYTPPWKKWRKKK